MTNTRGAKNQANKTQPWKSSSKSPATDHDLVKVYLNQMSHIPPISVEEERILARELEDSRAELREIMLSSPLVLSFVLQLLEKIVRDDYPVDRVLLIEANDNKKKTIIRKELLRTTRIVRRHLVEHKHLFDRYLRTRERRPLALRQNMNLKLRQVVALLLPYRMQVSRILPMQHETRLIAQRILQLQDQHQRLSFRDDDEALAETRAIEQAELAFQRRAGATTDQIRRYLISVDNAHERYEQAKKNLSKKNLRLVVSIAKKFRNKGLPFLDLIQEGNTGLMKALDRYQASRGNKFSTYATWWIKQTITRAIAYQSRTVRIPIHAINTLNKLIDDREDFIKKQGREPSVEEIAAMSGVDVKEVSRLLELNRSSLSLDQPYGAGEEGFFGELLEDDRSETPIQASHQIMLRESIASLLKTLSYREREVLKLRYGLGDGYTYTLEEVGAIFKVSRERIRQIEVGALAKLKLPQRRAKLSGFIDGLV